jgi:pyridoxamine 5'-phosphate oxidase
MSIADIRTDYRRAALTDADVHDDPIIQFQHWFDEAIRADVLEPNGMCLATATPDAYPSARMVLLKGVDARGFVFYTDYRSRKGQELADNPHASLCFFWPELERQVRINGAVQRVSVHERECDALNSGGGQGWVRELL